VSKVLRVLEGRGLITIELQELPGGGVSPDRFHLHVIDGDLDEGDHV
jgi:hypothetical protein